EYGQTDDFTEMELTLFQRQFHTFRILQHILILQTLDFFDVRNTFKSQKMKIFMRAVSLYSKIFISYMNDLSRLKTLRSKVRITEHLHFASHPVKTDQSAYSNHFITTLKINGFMMSLVMAHPPCLTPSLIYPLLTAGPPFKYARIVC